MSDEIASLSLLLFVAVLPACVVAIALLHVNKRLAAENRELLKANLAPSQKPEAVMHAAAMEITDRQTIAAEAQATAQNQPHRTPRLVGQ